MIIMWLVIIVMILLLVCVFLLANSPGVDRDTIFGYDNEPDEKGTKTPEK